MGSADGTLCSRKFNTFLQARFNTALVLKRTSARLWALVPITVAFIGDLLSEIIHGTCSDLNSPFTPMPIRFRQSIQKVVILVRVSALRFQHPQQTVTPTHNKRER